jgi:hypothetical protein
MAVLNTTVGPSEQTSGPTVHHSCTIFDRLLSSNRYSALSNGKVEQFTKLLVLDFLASSIYLSSSVELRPWATHHPFKWPQASIILGLAEPTDLRVENYVAALDSCEIALKQLQELAEAIDFVVDILVENYPVPQGAKDEVAENKFSADFDSERMFILQKLCYQRRNNTERCIERLNRTFEGRNKVLNIEESTSVKRLTILATIFLPLSLSASILSMGKRVVQLDLILYDFLGVFLIIGSFAVVMLFLVRVALRIEKSPRIHAWLDPRAIQARARERNRPTQRILGIVSSLLSIFYALVWTVLVVSFIVGMTVDVIKGLRVLGFGLAGLVGYIFIGCGLCFLIASWHRRTDR